MNLDKTEERVELPYLDTLKELEIVLTKHNSPYISLVGQGGTGKFKAKLELEISDTDLMEQHTTQDDERTSDTTHKNDEQREETKSNESEIDKEEEAAIAKFQSFQNYKRQHYRGDVYYCDLLVKKGSVQTNVRPVVILQNDTGNAYSPVTIVASMTRTNHYKDYPNQVMLTRDHIKTSRKDLEGSIVQFEQIHTVDVEQLKNYICTIDIDSPDMRKALMVSLGLIDKYDSNNNNNYTTSAPISLD